MRCMLLTMSCWGCICAGTGAISSSAACSGLTALQAEASAGPEVGAPDEGKPRQKPKKRKIAEGSRQDGAAGDL